MRHLLSWCGCLTLLVSCGCAICASPHDCKYAAYGGRRERTDMVHGRVASVFDPAPEVSHGVANGQSPQLAVPEATVPEGRRDADLPLPSTRPLPPSAEPTTPAPGDTEPELPNGTIELPGLEPGGFVPDDLPSPGTLPPDLPGNGDRSATRLPQQRILNERF